MFIQSDGKEIEQEAKTNWQEILEEGTEKKLFADLMVIAHLYDSVKKPIFP